MLKNYRLNYYSLFIIILFLFCNFYIVLKNSIYWDDWMLFNRDEGDIISQWTDYGAPILGYINEFLTTVFPDFLAFKILIFLSIGFSILLVYKIIKDFIKELDPFVFIILFVSIPVSFAKYSFVCWVYYFDLALFLFGTYLLLKGVYCERIRYILISQFIFFISFTTQSLFVFYALPILLLYIKDNRIFDFNFQLLFKNLKEFIVKNYLLLLAPIAFCLLVLFFDSRGNNEIAESYNRISMENIFAIPRNFISLCLNAIQSIIVNNIIKSISFLFIFIFILFYFIFRKKEINLPLINFKIGVLVFLFLFGIASISYLLVGKVPINQYAFTSRHELLLIFAYTFFAYFVLVQISIFKNKNAAKLGAIAILSIFLNASLLKVESLIKDDMYQKAVSAHINNISQIANGEFKAVVFNVENLETESNRHFKVKELCGILKFNLASEEYFGIDKREILNFEKVASSSLRKYFSFKDFKYTDRKLLVTFLPLRKLEFKDIFFYAIPFYSHRFDQNYFRNLVKVETSSI